LGIESQLGKGKRAQKTNTTTARRDSSWGPSPGFTPHLFINPAILLPLFIGIVVH
jgi:hypothetical protein